jgi:plasmid stabilization system protein ParE
MKKLFLTPKAELQLETILMYVEAKWSERVRKKVASKIDKNFGLIEKNPELFAFSSQNLRLRKCVVSKQTTIFYIERKNDIAVVSVFDTRQNPENI